MIRITAKDVGCGFCCCGLHEYLEAWRGGGRWILESDLCGCGVITPIRVTRKAVNEHCQKCWIHVPEKQRARRLEAAIADKISDDRSLPPRLRKTLMTLMTQQGAE